MTGVKDLLLDTLTARKLGGASHQGVWRGVHGAVIQVRRLSESSFGWSHVRMTSASS